MAKDGKPFQGVLFAGLMIVKGEPYLIEYNVRFGDPECQALMVRLKNDLLDLLEATADGTLERYNGALDWSSYDTICIVLASEGYPGSYSKGTVIKGVKEVDGTPHVKVFHAGTALDNDGNLVNIGGRVLNVVASGSDIEQAQKTAYDAVDQIDWPKGFCRRDIGWRAVKARKGKAA